jgi:hypothetical protein
MIEGVAEVMYRFSGEVASRTCTPMQNVGQAGASARRTVPNIS